MEPFTVRAVAILKAVPAGKVVTYGQVAAMAGDPRAARQVVRILVTMSEAAELPWHRVVNAKGQVSLPGAVGREQRRKLEAEGVELDEFGATSLARYQWRGPTTRPHDNT